MYLSSMTGFSRENGEMTFNGVNYVWFWEIKSVNGKAFDLKTKLPAAWEYLSPALKNIAAGYFSRGSISAFLELKVSGGEQTIRINEKILNKLMSYSLKLYQTSPEIWERPSFTSLLNLRGVVETEENSLNDEEREVLGKEILASFTEACSQMQKDREREGEKIKTALLAIVDKINDTVEKIAVIAAGQPPILKEKLQQQINNLLGDGTPVSEERLAQEVVLYVTRADVREEIDRLKAHIKTARELLGGGGTVGRRLDFLCQELNREANTTGSKSMNIDQTNLVMDLKALIEQLREQVQNIE